ncbi:MAG: AEC family transporter [Bacteroidales bacterium]|nr:AEC family transporter [Bacteroidales bacterium]MBN2755680.1 AEC family transporter [Bacteroidales bacterium]
MDEIFFITSKSVFGAMLRVFFIIFFAGLLVRKKIITTEQVSALSKITVFVLLPSLIFSNNILNFHPKENPDWWIIPIIGIGMSLVGVSIALILFLPDIKTKKNMLPVSSMQNAGYLVLPIVQILYPADFHVFALYTFLFIIGFNFILWSLGKVLVTSNDGNKISFKINDFINPPLIANLSTIIIVLISFQSYIPDFVIDSSDLLGKAAVPIATFVLGATLGEISFRKWPPIIDILRVNFTKFAIIPIITIFILYHFEIYKTHPFLSDFFIIQSAAAPATSIILQVKTYGGNAQKIGSMMIISYLICLVAMPLWFAFWKSLVL